MADERVGTRDFDNRRNINWTDLFAWTRLFRTFLIALDPFKLLVAAAGILATALGWWLLSAIFFSGWTEPKDDINDRKGSYLKDGHDEASALARATADHEAEAKRYRLMKQTAGPGGSFRTMPWFEDRGRNPFLLVRSTVSQGSVERRTAIDWLLASQAPVLVEPLLKFLSPIIGLFNPEANFWVRLYLFFLIVWMLMMWAFFGGIITRMAIVQIAGKEGGGLRDSIRFVKARYLSYVFSPIVPILLIFAVVIGCIVFGAFHLIPLFGDIVVDGLFWWIPLGAGFVMTLLVVGLVGYPLMYTTLSAEGSDTFDALSRSYNYVYESPWSYIWYAFLAILYGAVVVFFVVFWSSLMVYLGKWGVSQTPLTQSVNRSPEYLFIYTPTSFGWRELMLKGSPVEITSDAASVTPDAEGNRKLVEQTKGYYYTQPDSANQYMKEYSWYNYAGAGMVSFWMTLLFMLMLGFSYSYFWTAASMIYLLMRKKVDEVEIDEIYTEDEELEEPIAPPKLTPAAPAGPSVIPVDAPTLRVATPPTPAPEPPPVAPPPASTPNPAPEASAPPPALPPSTPPEQNPPTTPPASP